jgi:hypothetical protein
MPAVPTCPCYSGAQSVSAAAGSRFKTLDLRKAVEVLIEAGDRGDLLLLHFAPKPGARTRATISGAPSSATTTRNASAPSSMVSTRSVSRQLARSEIISMTVASRLKGSQGWVGLRFSEACCGPCLPRYTCTRTETMLSLPALKAHAVGGHDQGKARPGVPCRVAAWMPATSTQCPSVSKCRGAAWLM